MITQERLLHKWHTRNQQITVANVTLNEEEVMFAASVLKGLADAKLDALSDTQILGRCKSGYRSGVTVGVTVSSILIMQKTFSNLR